MAVPKYYRAGLFNEPDVFVSEETHNEDNAEPRKKTFLFHKTEYIEELHSKLGEYARIFGSFARG